MPGPRNAKRRKQLQVLKERRHLNKANYLAAVCGREHEHRSDRPYRPLPSQPLRYSRPVPRISVTSVSAEISRAPHDTSLVGHPENNPASSVSEISREYRRDLVEHSLSMRPPCIEHTGDGVRVRDVFDFIDSHFASPPSYEDPLCAEFAQEEVLDMLCAVLPEETAAVS